MKFKKTNTTNNNNNSCNLSFFIIFMSDKIKYSTKLSNMYELITDEMIATKNKAYNFDSMMFINAFPSGILQIKS